MVMRVTGMPAPAHNAKPASTRAREPQRRIIQNAIEAHKNRPFRWETQISPVPTYGIPSHHLRRS